MVCTKKRNIPRVNEIAFIKISIPANKVSIDQFLQCSAQWFYLLLKLAKQLPATIWQGLSSHPFLLVVYSYSGVQKECTNIHFGNTQCYDFDFSTTARLIIMHTVCVNRYHIVLYMKQELGCRVQGIYLI